MTHNPLGKLTSHGYWRQLGHRVVGRFMADLRAEPLLLLKRLACIVKPLLPFPFVQGREVMSGSGALPTHEEIGKNARSLHAGRRHPATP